MFTTITQVKEAFLKLFYATPIIVSVKGTNTTIPVRYAKKSADNYAEAGTGSSPDIEQQVYPCIAILDYDPKKSDMYNLSGFVRLANERDTDNDVKKQVDKATYYYEPLFLTFRFDVGVVSKKFFELEAINNYMYKRFLYTEHLILNKEVIAFEEVGDVVPLSVNPITIERPDGVKETNFEMEISAWVYIADQEDVDLLQTLNISVTPVLLPEQL